MTNAPLRVALMQEYDHGSVEANLDAIEVGLREAAAGRVQLVLLQELHNGPYFCQHESVDEFNRAEPIPGPSTQRIGALAEELGLVVVASLFERRAAGLYHNTAVVFDRKKEICGKYRKMHIPDDPAFYEKFYFTPGDLGFMPIETSIGKLGVLVCWDQWYPEAARLMALAGADLLLYPTAIGWTPATTPRKRPGNAMPGSLCSAVTPSPMACPCLPATASASRPRRAPAIADCSSGDRASSPGHRVKFWRKRTPTGANS